MIPSGKPVEGRCSIAIGQGRGPEPPAEMVRALTEWLGSRKAVARRLGVESTTVGRWTEGIQPQPIYLARLERLYDRMRLALPFRGREGDLPAAAPLAALPSDLYELALQVYVLQYVEGRLSVLREELRQIGQMEQLAGQAGELERVGPFLEVRKEEIKNQFQSLKQLEHGAREAR